MRRIALALLLIANPGGAICQEAAPTLTWLRTQYPVYPQMARIAHIQGAVTVVIEVHPDGVVVLQNAVGHPILVQAAKDAIQHSALKCNGCEQEAQTFVVVYKFKIEDPPPPPAPAPPPPKAPQKARSIRCLYLWRCGDAWM